MNRKAVIKNLRIVLFSMSIITILFLIPLVFSQLISNAEHLDENRTFVSNVNDYVNALDNNWTTIPSTHYIRVTFDINLTKNNFIEIYARGSNSTIELYRNNGTSLLDQITEVDSESYYRFHLDGLSEGEALDTFDLLSVGDVDYDYILDSDWIAGNWYNLTGTDTANWFGSNNGRDATYDSTNDLVYIGLNSGLFGVYNRTSNITTDLSGTDTGNWIGTSDVQGVTYPVDNLIYLGVSEGRFGVYNQTSNISVNLSGTDTADWIGSVDGINEIVYASNNLFYLAIDNGKFGVYNQTSNITTDLSTTDTGNWVALSSIVDLAYDSARDLVYTGMVGGKFGVYNITSNVWTDLSATDAANWVGTSTVQSVVYDSIHNLTYTGISAGKLGVYNLTSNIWSDLSATDIDNWAGTQTTNAFAYDSTRDVIYTIMSSGYFGVYAASSVITSSCTTITSSTTLTSDVSSTGTCMVINASNVVLDCAGYTINYNGDGGNSVYGIHLPGSSPSHTNITVKNCIIQDINSSGSGNPGIRLINVDNSMFRNNTIYINGIGNNAGVEFQGGGDYITYLSNTITTTGGSNNYGIYTQGVYDNITSNIIITNGTGANNYGIRLSSSSNSIVYNNNISTIGTTDELNKGIYVENANADI